jgi:hypothetical protein
MTRRIYPQLTENFMSLNHKPKRPAPDAYDHLWSLLPLFIAFLAMVMLAAALDDRQVQDNSATQAEPARATMAAAAPGRHRAADPSVPSADAALAALADVAAPSPATF